MTQDVPASTVDLRDYSNEFMELQEDALFLLDIDGTIVRANAGAEHLTGYTRYELIGTRLSMVRKEEAPIETLKDIFEYAAPDMRLRDEGWQIQKGGSTVWVDITITGIRDKRGALVGFGQVTRDATNRREREARLRESEERFRVMADASPVLLWLAGTNGECYFFNQPWLDFTGHSMEEECGVGWASRVHFEDFQACMQTYMSAFVKRESFRMEYRLLRADGVYRWILDIGVPRYTRDGDFAGYVGSCIDFTEIREAQELDRAMNLELRRSNAELEQFAYVASHDLQEPLRMVANYTALLRKKYYGKLDEQADKYISYATEGATRMHSLVMDLLTYSRVRSEGKAFASVSCNAVLQTVCKLLETSIQSVGGTIEIGTLPTVMFDEFQLQQVFQNLISNALKFRSEEPPRIVIEALKSGKEYIFSVSDNGIGFDMKYAERIFQMFQRLHDRTQFEGSGIGLSVTKRIVERHGGRIWVHSLPGQGTTIYFTIAVPEEAPVTSR